MEVAPNNRNALASLITEDVVLEILRHLPHSRRIVPICQIIFLFSDLITMEALILLHNDDRRLFEMEVAPNNRNALASLTKDIVLEILRCLPARSLLCCKCVCRS